MTAVFLAVMLCVFEVGNTVCGSDDLHIRIFAVYLNEFINDITEKKNIVKSFLSLIRWKSF